MLLDIHMDGTYGSVGGGASSADAHLSAFLTAPLHKTPFPFQSLLETLTVVLYPLKMG